MSHLLHKPMPLEGSLMLRERQDKTRPLTAMKPPVCIGTGWRICRIILMSHFKADISELSKLSEALGQTDNSRNSFLTRISLTQSLQQKAKSVLTPQLGTLMGKPPLVSTVVYHTLEQIVCRPFWRTHLIANFLVLWEKDFCDAPRLFY